MMYRSARVAMTGDCESGSNRLMQQVYLLNDARVLVMVVVAMVMVVYYVIN